jgi:chaperonin GroEL (HSP60 family)
MSQVVVTDRDNTNVVVESAVHNVLTQVTSTQTIVTGIMGPRGENSSISSSSDIDKTNLVNGATLVYASDASKWVATRLLDNQILEAGQF